jgi:hypothetical protein
MVMKLFQARLNFRISEPCNCSRLPVALKVFLIGRTICRVVVTIPERAGDGSTPLRLVIVPLIEILDYPDLPDVVATAMSLAVAAIGTTRFDVRLIRGRPGSSKAAVLMFAFAVTDCVAHETLRKHDCRFLR